MIGVGQLSINTREVSGIVMALLLVSCSTVESLKTDVMERFPKKQTAESSGGDATEQQADEVPQLTEQQTLVIEIQESLKTLGYSTGAVNGRLGAKTEAAIQDFQLDHGLRIDGKPSQTLLDLMKEEILSN